MHRRIAYSVVILLLLVLTACTLLPATPTPPEPFPPSPTSLPLPATATATPPSETTALPPTAEATTAIETSTTEPASISDDLIPIYTRALSQTIWVDRFSELYRDENAQVEIRISPLNLLSDVDGDGDEDRLVPLTFIRDTGGEFSEMAYLVNEGGYYTSTQSFLISEQVWIYGYDLTGNTLKVTLYTHGERDFLCCPTVPAEIFYEFDGTTWNDVARNNLPDPEPRVGETVGLTIENVTYDDSGFAQHPIVQLIPSTDHLPQDGNDPWRPERLKWTWDEIQVGGFTQPELLITRLDKTSQIDSETFESWVAAGSLEPYLLNGEQPPLLLGVYASLFLAAEPAYFDFGSGVGARYLVSPGLSQAYSTYDNIVYVYSGLTSDEEHIVTFIYPLSHPDFDAMLPLGATGDMEQEVQTLLEKVTAAADGDLAETIAMLDAFAASITIQP